VLKALGTPNGAPIHKIAPPPNLSDDEIIPAEFPGVDVQQDED
jgi:hypothetical protein